MVDGGEAVGDAGHGAVWIAVAVVDGLDETPAGDVIAPGGDFDVAAVGRGARGLHKALAVAALAHDGRAVEVLERACHNLGGGGGAAVGEHHEGSVAGLGGLVDFLGVGVAAACAHHFGAFVHEVADHLHGALEEAAAVAAEVEDDTPEARSAEDGCDSVAHLRGGLFVEGGEAYVAYAVGQHSIVGHGVDLDGAAGDVEAEQGILGVGAHDVDAHVRAGLAAQLLADIGDVHVRPDGVAVDAQDAVAVAYARLTGGRAPLGLGEDDVLAPALDGGAYAAVLAGGDAEKLVLLVGGIVLGIGVDLSEHGVYGRAHRAGGVDGVDVLCLQLLKDRVEYLHVACHFRLVAAGGGGSRGREQQSGRCDGKQDFLHDERNVYKSLFKNRCEREGGQSLSDFVIGMRECGRSHSTEEQSRKRQRVAGAMVFFEYLNSLNVIFEVSFGFASVFKQALSI